MERAQCERLALTLMLLCGPALARHDDDFAFDNTDEFQVDLGADHSEIAKSGLKRLWGVPDTTAYAGHLFRMEIPKEAFSGEVLSYKVRSAEGRRLPSWLAVDSRHGLLSGAPQQGDLGAHTFTVTAHGRTHGLTATDSFTIEVKKAEEKPQSKYGSCKGQEKRLVLVILVEAAFNQLAPRQRIRALMDLAHFMALDGDEFWMEPYKQDQTQTVLMSGGGSTNRKRNEPATAIYLNVGCGAAVWARHRALLGGVREQARDGTLAHVLRLRVRGWRLVALAPPRRKRQSPVFDDGSGDYDTEDGDYSGYDDYDADNEDADQYTDTNDLDHKVKITPYMESASEASVVNSSQAVNPRLLNLGPVIVPEDPRATTEAESPTVIIRASDDDVPMSSPSTLLTSPTTPTTPPPPPTTTEPTTPTQSTTPTTLPTTTPAPQTTPIPPPTTSETTIEEVKEDATVMITPYTDLVSEATNFNYSQPDQRRTFSRPTVDAYPTTEQDTPPVPSGRPSTITGVTTETVMFTMPTMPVNQPPTLKHHMKKLATTAGKAFRYIIPTDLFTDPEDGSNLTFTMYEADNVPLNKKSWVQFLPNDREVYGLPLEAHVSRWNFIVEAQDSEGQVARGPLDITVQQHKGVRTINHRFIMTFKLNKQYAAALDWQIRALEGIVNLFRISDMDHLTVLNATQNGDTCEFVWTNDTLPKESACPIGEINQVMKILESSGGPSPALTRAMSPELQVSGVRWAGAGACSAPPATRAPDTYPPVTRNQVDHLTASVGHLLVYKVPEDTFFDPEDGGTRNLQLSLRYVDRSEVPRGHWLQFDVRNQEFYGLPTQNDVGSVNYQLIAEDSSKKSAYDSLVVEVVKAPSIRPTVEFQMTMDYPFPSLAYDANNKRKVVEKLAALFGQRGTDNIRIHSITDNPTTIIWYNTSLPMDHCPKRDIEELRRMIIVDERNSVGGALKENVDTVFDKDFKVMSIRLIPLGLCADQNTKTPKAPVPAHPGNNMQNKAGSAADHTEYLITFIIPAVVVVCMIFVAGLIACLLYRKRRRGKMSVGDEEERQAFRSKGIPVIFQDELEERGDSEPVHKSPVIMREEKPPLLPPAPDYRSEDAPYRPPPPFAASRTPPRPKATPTYRKPPPYVPP